MHKKMHNQDDDGDDEQHKDVNDDDDESKLEDQRRTLTDRTRTKTIRVIRVRWSLSILRITSRKGIFS